MSYNIDTWKTKKLERLVIPLDALYPKGGRNPDRPKLQADGTFLIEGGAELMEIRGTVEAGEIHVSSIECCYERSGHFLEDTLLPALRRSRGTLEATLVWEGGDSITRLKVTDGEVSNEEVEI